MRPPITQRIRLFLAKIVAWNYLIFNKDHAYQMYKQLGDSGWIADPILYHSLADVYIEALMRKEKGFGVAIMIVDKNEKGE